MGGDIGVLLTSNSTRDPIWACPAAVVPGRQQAEHADRPAVSAETARPRKGRPGGLRTSANVEQQPAEQFAQSRGSSCGSLRPSLLPPSLKSTQSCGGASATCRGHSRPAFMANPSLAFCLCLLPHPVTHTERNEAAAAPDGTSRTTDTLIF